MAAEDEITLHRVGQIAHALDDQLAGLGLVRVGSTGKERLVALVDLGRDERERLEQMRVAHRTGRRHRRVLVGDPVQNRDVLGQHLAGIERQRRHVALGIDGRVILAGLGLLGLEIDLDVLERQPGLMQGDMVGQTASAGRESRASWLMSSRCAGVNAKRGAIGPAPTRISPSALIDRPRSRRPDRPPGSYGCPPSNHAHCRHSVLSPHFGSRWIPRLT